RGWRWAHRQDPLLDTGSPRPQGSRVGFLVSEGLRAVASVRRADGSRQHREGLRMTHATLTRRVTPDLVERLSRREMQVFRRLADGLTIHQIGREMGISFKTVEVHRNN